MNQSTHNENYDDYNLFLVSLTTTENIKALQKKAEIDAENGNISASNFVQVLESMLKGRKQ